NRSARGKELIFPRAGNFSEGGAPEAIRKSRRPGRKQAQALKGSTAHWRDDEPVSPSLDLLVRQELHLRLSNHHDRRIGDLAIRIGRHRRLSIMVLGETNPRFRQFKGEGPMFRLVQLCGKTVTLLRPPSELRPPWHHSSQLLQNATESR